MGSKNAIVKWIIDLLPAAENFYDLFAGGCAVTHAAMESGKWKYFTINDIISDPTDLFIDGILGKCDVCKQWISREDFFKLKDRNPIVKYCWSFGNNGQSYLCAKEKEGQAKAYFLYRLYGGKRSFLQVPAEALLRALNGYRHCAASWIRKHGKICFLITWTTPRFRLKKTASFTAISHIKGQKSMKDRSIMNDSTGGVKNRRSRSLFPPMRCLLTSSYVLAKRNAGGITARRIIVIM